MLPVKYKDRRSEGGTTLRQCQLAQLHILYVVDAICKEKGVRYFLGGGTLIGAMRHGGFIPWDDDLDICVPADEFTQFVKTMRESLPPDIVLQTPSDVPFTAIPFVKLRDTCSFYCECRDDVSTSDPSGIYIDVFPYEDMPEIGRALQRLFIKSIGSTWMRTIWFRNQARRGLVVGVPALVVSGFLCAIHHLLRFALYVLKRLLPCRSVCNLCEMGLTYLFKKSDVYPLAVHRFEDGEFPVPGNADGVLTSQYGDWRKMPPPEKREWHARIIDPFKSAM